MPTTTKSVCPAGVLAIKTSGNARFFLVVTAYTVLVLTLIGLVSMMRMDATSRPLSIPPTTAAI